MNQQSITFYFPIHLYLPNRSGIFVIATAIFIMVVGYFSFKMLIDEIWLMAILSLAMIGYGVYMLICWSKLMQVCDRLTNTYPKHR